MTKTYAIGLQFSSLKNLNLHSCSSYYLVARYSSQPHTFEEITTTHDIMQGDAVYTLQHKYPLKSLEIWNYDRRKKVATLQLTKLSQNHHFEHSFINHNLKLTLDTPHYSIPELASTTPDKPEQLDSSHSTEQNSLLVKY